MNICYIGQIFLIIWIEWNPKRLKNEIKRQSEGSIKKVSNIIQIAKLFTPKNTHLFTHIYLFTYTYLFIYTKKKYLLERMHKLAVGYPQLLSLRDVFLNEPEHCNSNQLFSISCSELFQKHGASIFGKVDSNSALLRFPNLHWYKI